MENGQITDKVYYFRKDWDKNPKFVAYEIQADRTHQYGDVEQFNEFVLQLMIELTKDKLVENCTPKVGDETADDYFIQGKMLAAEYTWEEKEGWIFKRVERYPYIHTLSKENEYLKFTNNFTQNRLGFDVKIYQYKDLDFSVNDPQTVIDYITSDDEILYIWPEIENPVCNILINPKHISLEELIEFLTKFVESTGRTLEVDI